MKKSNSFFFIAFLTILECFSCKVTPVLPIIATDKNTLFSLLDTAYTGVHFSNTLAEGLNTNVLMYDQFYNGAGVSVGDVNGDGLDDIYFTGNMVPNKLYLNKGHMQFQDISEVSGVEGRTGPWKTGVTMVDINGDGKLDLYVCYSGKLSGDKRMHQLFVNEGNDKQGIPHFSEKAQDYGLADSSFSTQAVFFDYDRDGDLDMLLVNHNPKRLNVIDDVSLHALLQKNDPVNGCRLFKNDNGFFRDITQQSGINSSPLSYSNGAMVADINGDGWPDIYIGNDFLVPDYLYINDKKGHFVDEKNCRLGHTSYYTMGIDIADINNDGRPDIFTADMLPEDNRRQKLLFGMDNYDLFNIGLRQTFYYQYMRNMMHVNNGNGTFSEIGQLAGISNTDWSWAPLFADFDNDGWKDLYITNGFARDYTNLDFMKYMGDQLQNRKVMRQDLMNLVQQMPSTAVKNYIFRNNGSLGFKNMRKEWGFDTASNSNGAAYADLDNDGDLDIVVNNVNQRAFIYENHADRIPGRNHFLTIQLKGLGKNTEGIGARLTIYQKGNQQYAEQFPCRGYQSSVTPVIHFGLGADEHIDSLKIIWQTGRWQVLKNVTADRRLNLYEKDAMSPIDAPQSPAKPLFTSIKSPIPYRFNTSDINDFKRQPLLINPLSFSGPCMAKGDVNRDKLDDIYVGGGNGKAGVLYIRQTNGQFLQTMQPDFEKDRNFEDYDAVFFDANGDGFNDLYVVSGGYHHFAAIDSALQDRLYINDGKGHFKKSKNALPPMFTSKSCVKVSDINNDGYPDLFIGGRVIPGRYPETPQSYLLINNGKGVFTDQTFVLAPELQEIGMVTDAVWIDLNNDGKDDLVVVGEWMPITVFINKNGKLENRTTAYFDQEYKGWWNKIVAADFNGDGKPDLVVANFGLNAQFKANDQQPVELYFKDFDDNGSVDPIFCFYIQGKSYPYVTRDELFDQVSMIRNRFPEYKSYADATIKDIFSESELHGTGHLQANCLETSYFESTSGTKFQKKELPLQAQLSPVFVITALDVNKDGNLDLVFAGNINHARLRFGKYDASYGVLLEGDGKGHFRYVKQPQSGLQLTGDVRSSLRINDILLFGVNQGFVKAYKFNNE